MIGDDALGGALLAVPTGPMLELGVPVDDHPGSLGEALSHVLGQRAEADHVVVCRDPFAGPVAGLLRPLNGQGEGGIKAVPAPENLSSGSFVRLPTLVVWPFGSRRRSVSVVLEGLMSIHPFFVVAGPSPPVRNRPPPVPGR